MQDRVFTKKFFTAPVVTGELDSVVAQKSIVLNQLYGATPLYISSQKELPTPEQAKILCNSFQELDPNSTLLYQQLKTVIANIKQWCHQNGLQHSEKWDQLSARITIHPSDYLVRGLTMFQWFTEGKSALEGIFFVLNDNNIAIERKKRVLKKLLDAESLTACAEGVLTNVKNSHTALQLDWAVHLMRLRLEWVTQHAVNFFREKRAEVSQLINMDVGEGVEIHFANEFRNNIAKDLGLTLHNDAFFLMPSFFINTIIGLYSNQLKSEIKKSLNFSVMMDKIVLSTMEKISDLPDKDLSLALCNALKTDLDQLGSDDTFNTGNWFYEEESEDVFKYKKIPIETIWFRLQCTLIKRLRKADYLDNAAFSITSTAEKNHKVINIKGVSLLSYAWVESTPNNNCNPPLSLESFFKENLEQSSALPLNVFLKKHLKKSDYLLLELFYAIKKQNHNQAILHLKQLQEALKNSSGIHQVEDPLTLQLLKHLEIKTSCNLIRMLDQYTQDLNFEKVNAFIHSIPELVNVAQPDSNNEEEQNMNFVQSLIAFLMDDLPAHTSSRLEIESALAALEEKALELEKAGIDKAGSAFELICALKSKNDLFFSNADKSRESRDAHIQACKDLVNKHKPMLNKLRSSEFTRGLHRAILTIATVLSFGILLAVPKVRQTLFTDLTETQTKAEAVIAALEKALIEKDTGCTPKH